MAGLQDWFGPGPDGIADKHVVPSRTIFVFGSARLQDPWRCGPGPEPLTAIVSTYARTQESNFNTHYCATVLGRLFPRGHTAVPGGQELIRSEVSSQTDHVRD